MADFEKHLILSRTYHKGTESTAIFIREITGEVINGSEFQFEMWVNGVEDVTERIVSSDRSQVRDKLFARELDLDQGGWSLTNSCVFANPNSDFFNPEHLRRETANSRRGEV